MMKEKKGRPLAALLINIGKDKGGKSDMGSDGEEMGAPQLSACEDMMAAAKSGDAEKFGSALRDFIRLERRPSSECDDGECEDDSETEDE